MVNRRSRGPGSVRALYITLLIFMAGCTARFTLQAIEVDSVPEEIRVRTAHASYMKEVVWRACFPVGDSQFTVLTYRDSEHGQPRFAMSLLRSGEAHPYSTGGGGLGFLDKPFGAYFSQENQSAEDGIIERRMIAYGNAFDARVAQVIGITASGLRVESPVVNGFWCLQIVNPQFRDAWESIVAVTSAGNIRHRFQIPESL